MKPLLSCIAYFFVGICSNIRFMRVIGLMSGAEKAHAALTTMMRFPTCCFYFPGFADYLHKATSNCLTVSSHLLVADELLII